MAAGAAATMALACAALTLWFFFEVWDQYGGVEHLPDALRNLGYKGPQVLIATTGYAALVMLLLVGGAIRLMLGRRKGRRMTVLGGLGFIAGAVGSQIAVQYLLDRSYNDYVQAVYPLLMPLRDSLAVAGSAMGVVLAFGAIICAMSVRR